MFKTLDIDRNTIERKYHNPDEEFNSFMRMWYHGYDYDETTGLDDAKMKEGLSALSEKLEGQPHPIHKAKLFEYVLDNTRIDINEHDYFIGMYSWGRPISEFTVFKWSDDVYRSYPEEAKILKKLDASGATRGWLDFDHTVPDWDSLAELGFSGILKRAEKSYEAIKNAEIGNATIASLVTKKITVPEGTESTADNTESKLIIVSSASFMSDIKVPVLNQSYPLSYLVSNADFAINSIGYLGEKENMLTIRKDYASATYTPTEAQNIIVIVIIYGVPILIIIAGIVVWIYRKKRK